MKLGWLSPRAEVFSIIDFFKISDITLGNTPIEWTDVDPDVLIVGWGDLINYTEPIPWTDINIIIAETYQQVFDYRDKLNYSKDYIFVTESWVEPSILKRRFPGLKIVATYSRFLEIVEYGQRFFDPMIQLSRTEISKRTPKYDFFSLIGRHSRLRSHFVNRLISTVDVSNSLVKFQGSVVEPSGAPDLDPISYDPSTFYFTNNTFAETPWLIPSKLIPVKLYQQFLFEVQHETDPYQGSGWEIPEFHLTEKTLKPLLTGVPCLMFGPAGYNTWLKDAWGIDIGLGQFDRQYDSLTNNMQRLDFMIMQIPNLIANKISVTNPEQHEKNIKGFLQLGDFNISQMSQFYQTIRSL